MGTMLSDHNLSTLATFLAAIINAAYGHQASTYYARTALLRIRKRPCRGQWALLGNLHGAPPSGSAKKTSPRFNIGAAAKLDIVDASIMSEMRASEDLKCIRWEGLLRIRLAVSFVMKNALACALASLFMAALALPTRAQGTVKGVYGDWELRCDQSPQPPVAGVAQPATPREQCILYQNIADEKDDALSLRISVSKVSDPKTPGQRRPVLLVVARLGVLLPRGLALRIDQTEIGSTGFVRCIPEGCVAQVDMDDGLLEKFRKGQTATFIIALTPEEQRGLPLALDGFDKGYAALQ